MSWHKTTLTPPKTNMTMDKSTMNEDVFPIENGIFSMSCYFRGVIAVEIQTKDYTPDHPQTGLEKSLFSNTDRYPVNVNKHGNGDIHLILACQSLTRGVRVRNSRS